MLFHLKEPDYKTEAPGNVITRFYGRRAEQILAVLDYYAERAKREGNSDNPNLAWWLKRKFSTTDIEQVEQGEFYFFTGMISLAEGDRPIFDEEIKVKSDFSILVPHENMGYFALWRLNVMQFKRGGLYKLQSPIDMFKNISFVPEDIARAIMSCDLTSHRKVIEEDIARRAELSQHPSVKVDGLQRILETRRHRIVKNN